MLSSVKETLPTLTEDPAMVSVTLVPADDIVEDASTPEMTVSDVGAAWNEEGNATRMEPPIGIDLLVVNETVAVPVSPAFGRRQRQRGAGDRGVNHAAPSEVPEADYQQSKLKNQRALGSSSGSRHCC